MSSSKLISEIFDDFVKAENKEGKIAVLRKWDHPTFRLFFEYLYNPKIVFDVSIPKYRPAKEPAGLNFTYIDTEIPKLYRFIKNHPQRIELRPEKLTNLLCIVLESLHKDEAEILVNLLNKDLKIKYLSPKLVKEAFPGINI